MPLTVNFTLSQILGNPSGIVLNDTSTGTDVAVTQRRIYLQKYDGTYLVPSGTLTSYIAWPLGVSTSITINPLDKDYALSVLVQWLNVGNTVLYSKTILSVFNMYASTLDDFLISGQQANPSKINDTNYYLNRIKLRVAINDAINSISDMSDITNSQQACDRGNYFVDNQSNLF